MASLNLALNNALTGLDANKQALNIISQNLANANTPGYSRQIVEQTARYVQGVGSGVQIENVVRKVDDFLLRASQTQASQVERNNVIADYQDRVQIQLGQPGSGNSLDTYIANFFNVAKQLSDLPDSSANRSNLISSARTLANRISDVAESLEDLRYQADRDIRTATQAVNQSIAKLGELNKGISAAYVSRQSTAGLLDARDAEIENISKYMDVAVTYSQTGAAYVTTTSGVALVDELNHKLVFNTAESVSNFINNDRLGSLQLLTLDANGVEVGARTTLVTSDVSSDVTSVISSGRIGGYLELRDRALPRMLDELDMLAANLRNAVNEIQNAGTAYPPPRELTGTRPIRANDEFSWAGAVRIAVLDATGAPIPAPYADETAGFKPLLLDLASLESGSGNGRPSMQAIINEINNHYHVGNSKTKLGNLNNVQMSSVTPLLPSTDGNFVFDFDLDNISKDTAQFFVSNITVKNDAATDITSVTQNVPTIALDVSSTFQTTNGSGDVVITLQSATEQLRANDYVYLSAPSITDANGISAAQLTGYLRVKAIDGNQITLETAGTANATGTVSDPATITMQEPFHVEPGLKQRTKDFGKLAVDLNSDLTSDYYDITVTVAVIDENGTRSDSNLTYRVKNNQLNLFNERYEALVADQDASIVLPTTTQNGMQAILVDENGVEIPKADDGTYINAEGYLKLIGGGTDYRIAIDSSNSQQLGKFDVIPPEEGSNRGFSFFFGMNNFFTTSDPIPTGDAVKNSAINLRVEDRLINDPNLISVANLQRVRQSSNAADVPRYTYELQSGDNSTALKLSNLVGELVRFEAAGDLATSSVTLITYTGQLLASYASKSSAAASGYDNAQILYDGYKEKLQSTAGVNLDEELANTIVYQNAYAATARIITTVDEMFKEIIAAIGG